MRLLGNGFFKTCATPANVKKILIELKGNPSLCELGKYANNSGSRNDLATFEQVVKSGVTNEQLLVLFPKICSRYLGFANNHLRKSGIMAMKMESPNRNS